MEYIYNGILSERVNVAQSCPTLCDPMDYEVPEILQARTLEWVALSLFQGIIPNSGMEPRSPALQADSLPAESPGKPVEYYSVKWNITQS